jgi:hypothetical protein
MRYRTREDKNRLIADAAGMKPCPDFSALTWETKRGNLFKIYPNQTIPDFFTDPEVLCIAWEEIKPECPRPILTDVAAEILVATIHARAGKELLDTNE